MTTPHTRKARTTTTFMPPMTLTPCPRCLALAVEHEIRGEMVQPLPQGAWAPRGPDGPCCFDCAAADTIQRIGLHPDFVACRIAVGNERQEHLRLPWGVRMGLVKAGYVRMEPCGPEAFRKHLAWLDSHVWPQIPSVPTDD